MGAQVTLVWLPGHSNIELNEVCDQLAKNAQHSLHQRTVNIDDSSDDDLPWAEGLCLTEIYTAIKDAMLLKAAHHWSTLDAEDFGLKHVYPKYPPRPTVRAQWQPVTGSGAGQDHHMAVLRAQLRMACSRLQQHWDPHNPLCQQCGSNEETTQHYVLHCQTYAEERKQLFEALKEAAQHDSGLHLTNDIESMTLQDVFRPTSDCRRALNDYINATRRFRFAGEL